MAEWDGWNLDRALLLFTAVAYLVIWIQLSLYHWAGGFKHVAMWGPVLTTPLVSGGAVLGAVRRDGVWGWVALGLLAFAIVEGLLGLYFHVQGIRSQIGGFSLRNVLSGPPPMLPLAYAAMGTLGIGALIWNA
jgi:hypothetical protein